MPPKKAAATLTKEDTAQSENSNGLQREARLKRGANYREYQEEGQAVLLQPSFDIESLDFASLRKYRKVHRVPTTLDAVPTYENPTQAPRRYLRVEKEEELVGAVKRHWSTATIKESDAIVSFLYAARNQHRTFKMKFAP